MCGSIIAREDQSFQAIMACTPRSKQSLHGIGYCFSPGDNCRDSKLTKIQQRYLISERTSNCSTISTPMAHRVMREARRKKEARLKAEREAIAAAKTKKRVDAATVGGVIRERQQEMAGEKSAAEGTCSMQYSYCYLTYAFSSYLPGVQFLNSSHVYFLYISHLSYIISP